MIVGENARDTDIAVNITREKQLTNMRASGSDDAFKIAPPRVLSLEEAIAFINDDEMVEVTPDSLRLRKIYLSAEERKRMEKETRAAD
jgi:GTP-binding protein